MLFCPVRYELFRTHFSTFFTFILIHTVSGAIRVPNLSGQRFDSLGQGLFIQPPNLQIAETRSTEDSNWVKVTPINAIATSCLGRATVKQTINVIFPSKFRIFFCWLVLLIKSRLPYLTESTYTA